MAAFVAVCLSERAVVLIVAPDPKQSRVIFRYCVALLESTPALAELIVRKTVDTIDLSTGVSIEVGTASFRTPRGYSLRGVVPDEIAYMRSDESANPDTEIMRAVRPGWQRSKDRCSS
jgi:hypothetical protein